MNACRSTVVSQLGSQSVCMLAIHKHLEISFMGRPSSRPDQIKIVCTQSLLARACMLIICWFVFLSIHLPVNWWKQQMQLGACLTIACVQIQPARSCATAFAGLSSSCFCCALTLRLMLTWVKKKPDSQYTAGGPLSIQSWKKRHLSKTSFTYDPRLCREQDKFIHAFFHSECMLGRLRRPS